MRFTVACFTDVFWNIAMPQSPDETYWECFKQSLFQCCVDLRIHLRECCCHSSGLELNSPGYYKNQALREDTSAYLEKHITDTSIVVTEPDNAAVSTL